jgi:hypothetical protein
VFQQYAQYGYWKVRVIQKHRVPASWRHLIPPAFVLTTGALVALSPLWPSVRPATALVVGAYLACTLAASMATASATEWRLLPALPATFACFHLGYGYGFLRGVWDFVIRRRGPAKPMSALSRPGPVEGN